MMRVFLGRACILGGLLTLLFSRAAAEGLATIETHTQRYGTHIAISAYDDPLVKGVTCYVSESHADFPPGNRRISRGSDMTASCHQTGNMRVSGTIPRQAQVFTADVDARFDSLHIIRVLDIERHALVYFSYTEDETAGNLPGHTFVIRLPRNPGVPVR